MSTALAIAATTRVLGALIDQTITNADVSGVLGSGPPYLTSRAPDQLETGSAETVQLALFLYHVTRNQGWTEVGLPSRDSSGNPINRPPLALDLHYLLIAYGDSEYAPQILLGLGMQALHETPFLYREQITSVFTPPPPLNPIDGVLATAELAEQVEMIKVTPEPLSTEDLSKLWTAFGSKFRPCAGYEATVVLIESTAPIASALPVRQRNLAVLALSEPSITAVSPQQLPWAPSLALTLTGENLTVPGSIVVFDRNPQSPETPQPPPRPQPLSSAGTMVTTAVPILPAGLNTLRVVQQVAIGEPPAKNVVQSNVSLFYLQPVIRQNASPPGDYLITVGPVDTSVTPALTPVTVELDPALQSTQEVQLLLNELEPPAGDEPLSFTFDAEPSQIAVNSVTFSTFGTRSGPYLLRVRVDGAQSTLETDSTTGAYSAPTVSL